MEEVLKRLNELFAKIDENNSLKTQNEELNAKISEQNASVEQLQSALDDVKKERGELDEKYDTLWKEAQVLREEIAKAKVKERVGELNAALADYTEDEKKYAETEINAFNEDPASVEINSIIDKINLEIGKATKAAAKAAAEAAAAAAAEQNQKHNEETHPDIFSEVNSTGTNNEVSIF